MWFFTVTRTITLIFWTMMPRQNEPSHWRVNTKLFTDAVQTFSSDLHELPALLAHFDTCAAGISIVNLFHFFDRIEKTDDEGRAKGFARSDGSAANFLDQANITALMAPGLAESRWILRRRRIVRCALLQGRKGLVQFPGIPQSFPRGLPLLTPDEAKSGLNRAEHWCEGMADESRNSD